MAHIKSVLVSTIALTATPVGIGFYWQHHTFVTFTDDNGNVTYLVDDKQSSKEDGNKIFTDLKESNKHWLNTSDGKKYIERNPSENTFEVTASEYDITYEEIIEKLENSIDHYACYIDSYKQKVEADKRNAEIRTKIAAVKKLAAER